MSATVFDRFNDAITKAFFAKPDLPADGPEVVHTILAITRNVALAFGVNWPLSLACEIAVSGATEDEAVAEVRAAFAAKRGDIGSVTS